MKKTNLIKALLAVSLLLCLQVHAQKNPLKVTDSTHLAVVKLKGDNTFIGKITEITDSKVTMVSDAGTNIIERKQIVENTETTRSALHKGVYWFPNPNAERLVFAPTGYMLKKGEIYIEDFELVFLSANVGITDHVSLG